MSVGWSDSPWPSRSSVMTRCPRPARCSASGVCIRRLNKSPCRRTVTRGPSPCSSYASRRPSNSNVAIAADLTGQPRGRTDVGSSTRACARARSADNEVRMEASAAPHPAAPARKVGLRSARLLRLAADERLVALVRQGSQPAFEVIYDRHHRGILSFCRHMLSSREEAEDAVQHTFMAAYGDLVGSEKDIQLRAWLYAIARNRCLSILRSRREQPVE